MIQILAQLKITLFLFDSLKMWMAGRWQKGGKLVGKRFLLGFLLLNTLNLQLILNIFTPHNRQAPLNFELLQFDNEQFDYSELIRPQSCYFPCLSWEISLNPFPLLGRSVRNHLLDHKLVLTRQTSLVIFTSQELISCNSLCIFGIGTRKWHQILHSPPPPSGISSFQHPSPLFMPL